MDSGHALMPADRKKESAIARGGCVRSSRSERTSVVVRLHDPRPGVSLREEVGMAVVWSAVCALAALAAGVQQGQPVADAPQMKTRVLPGHGYIRYEVLPGDDEA